MRKSRIAFTEPNSTSTTYLYQLNQINNSWFRSITARMIPGFSSTVNLSEFSFDDKKSSVTGDQPSMTERERKSPDLI
jgi:hypothetical protein